MQQVGLESIYKDAGFNAGIKAFQNGIHTATAAAEKGAGAIGALGNVMKGTLVVGIGAAVTAFGALAAASKVGLDAAIKRGEDLDKLADMFGLNAKQADTFATAFAHFGIPLDEAGQQINFFTRGLAEAVKLGKDSKATLTPFGESLQKLGVKATDAKGKLKTFDQVLPQIMDAFAKLPAGVNKSNLAMELFGARGGSKFLDFLSSGSKALKDATKRVDEFGAMTDDQRDALEDFGFALNDVKDGLQKIWSQIGIAVLPILRRFVDYLNKNVLPIIAKWVKDNMPALTRALDNFAKIIQIHVLPFVQRLADTFKQGGLAGVFQRLADEISHALPMVIAGLSKLKDRFWEWLTGKGGVLEQVAGQLGKIVDAIQAWFKSNGATIAAQFDKLRIQFWNWLTGAIKEIGTKLAEFVIALDNWAKSAEGQSALYEAGKSISKPVASGITGLLADASTGESMSGGLQSAVMATMDLFVQVGKAIGRGLIDGAIEGAQQRWSEIDWYALLTGGADTSAMVSARKRAQDDFRIIYGRDFNPFNPDDTKAFNELVEKYFAEAGRKGAMSFRDSTSREINSGVTIGMLSFSTQSAVSSAVAQSANANAQSGRNVGQTFANATSQAIINSRGQIVGAITAAINGGSASAVGTAYGSGYNLGVTFDNGIMAGLQSRGVAIGALIGGLIGAGIPSFQLGGIMPYTGLAMLHAGERVIPAPNVNNSRTSIYNFSHTWNAPVTTEIRGMTEQMVRTVTHQEIVEVFGSA